MPSSALLGYGLHRVCLDRSCWYIEASGSLTVCLLASHRAVGGHHTIKALFAPAGRPWGWLAQLAGRLKIQHPVRFILNFVALLALMRFWPMSGQRHPLGVSEPITVQVTLGLTSGWLPVWGNGVDGFEHSCLFTGGSKYFQGSLYQMKLALREKVF